ncbi:hypothetical protein [Enterovibrio coralii]|uniref:Uncharacterized protein n=1 Tax=Enterovibrio coralii TaxID=294935 RepID=A0A135I9D2_9GAMM|nr:hypothetical protein [Enterovibrio coralii]KXF81994.1 hypothetical protein ATN88_18775 [Enterovibrio coralii]
MSSLRALEPIVIDEENIARINDKLRHLNEEISVSMSFVRRANGMSYEQLNERMTGIKFSTLKRYFQQSYTAMKPLHFLAALSWVLMVPMTSFYHGLRIKEHYRGMDDKAVEALLSVGRIPSFQFETALDLIASFMAPEQQREFRAFREKLQDDGVSKGYNDLMPPEKLDINLFAIDYYRSIAITMKRFRTKHKLSHNTMAHVLGMSQYQYSALEDERRTVQFPVSLGVRAKLGFMQSSHVEFTSEMTHFPEFHRLRQTQHLRDMLIVEAMRLLAEKQKAPVANILKEISALCL